MSTSADATLEAIDGCLRDNSVSEDAMRWSPAVEADEGSAVASWPGQALPLLAPGDGTVSTWQFAPDGNAGWLEIGHTEDGAIQYELPGEVSGAGYSRGCSAGFSPSLVIYDEVAAWSAATASVTAFAEGMKGISRALTDGLLPFSRLFSGMSSQLAHAADRRDRPRWHRNRCRECNPAGNPLPLEGGAEYRRRQKARKRRAR